MCEHGPGSFQCLGTVNPQAGKGPQAEVLNFCSHRDDEELLQGIDVLGGLNRTGRRKVPSDAPLTFVPKSCLPFVLSGEDKVSRPPT
jgi:hypothetical protein